MIWISKNKTNIMYVHHDHILITSSFLTDNSIPRYPVSLSIEYDLFGSAVDAKLFCGVRATATTEKIDDLTPRGRGSKRSAPSSFSEVRNDSSSEDEDEMLIFEMNRKPLESYLREAEVVFASGLNKENLQDTAVLSLTLSRANLLKYLTLRRVNFSMRSSQKTLEATAKAHAKSNLNAKDSKKKIEKQPDKIEKQDDKIKKPNDNAETHVNKEQMLPLEDLFDRKIKAMAEAMNKATKSEMEKVSLL